MSIPSFFALIIGTEILNRRRVDKHFDFVTSTLLERGHKLRGSFIIDDDPELIVQSINFIKSQPNSVLFCFGGIGSTPDDYTRLCAAKALGDGVLYLHDEAKEIISSNIDTSKRPHALNMAMLPKDANLIDNPVNKMPAFSLEDRYFFMPGFPEMSHPMVKDIMDRYFPDGEKLYRSTLTAYCTEGSLIPIMEQMPEDVELSSLPAIIPNGWKTVISLASKSKELTDTAMTLYIDELTRQNIKYELTDQDA